MHFVARCTADLLQNQRSVSLKVQCYAAVLFCFDQACEAVWQYVINLCVLEFLCVCLGQYVEFSLMKPSRFLQISSPPTNNRVYTLWYLSELNRWRGVCFLAFCNAKSRHASWYWCSLTMKTLRRTYSHAQTPFSCSVLVKNPEGVFCACSSWVAAAAECPHTDSQANPSFRHISEISSSFHESLPFSYLLCEETRFLVLYRVSQHGCWLRRNNSVLFFFLPAHYK